MSKTPSVATAPSHLGDASHPFSITRHGVLRHKQEPLAPSHIAVVQATIGDKYISWDLDPPLKARKLEGGCGSVSVEAGFPNMHGLISARVDLQPTSVLQKTIFNIPPGANFGLPALIKAADRETGGHAEIPTGAIDARFFSALISAGFNVQIIIGSTWKHCQVEKGALVYSATFGGTFEGSGNIKPVPIQAISSSRFKISKGGYAGLSGFEIEATGSVTYVTIQRGENKAFTDPQLLAVIAKTFSEYVPPKRPPAPLGAFDRFGR